MFYSAKIPTIDTKDTHLLPQQVFTGNYWDEFGFTPFLVPENANVLMLGLSLGGGIRPLLSSTKNIRLTCIDIDEESVNACKENFHTCFTDLSFATEVSDAAVYLEKKEARFDLIWLDIYEQDSYSSLVFNQDFLAKVKKNLTPEGVLAVNAYGLPNQFKPLEKPGVQSELAGTLQKAFGYVGHLPFRRNQTLFASQERPKIFPANPHPCLSALDKKSFAVQKQRIEDMSSVPTPIPGAINLQKTSKFIEIDKEMRQGWSGVVSKLAELDVHIEILSDLLSLIQNEAICSAVLDKALLRKDDFVSFVAILAAGEFHIQDLELSWLFAWTSQNRSQMQATFEQMYRQIWLPQLWSLTLHPSRKYRHFCFQVSELLQEKT